MTYFNRTNKVLAAFIARPRNLFQLKHVIVQFFKNCKYAWQRIVRGYSDMDLWNFDTYLQKVMSCGIRSFTEIMTGYPDGYETFEDWKKELLVIADLIEKFNTDDCIDWDSDAKGAEFLEMCENATEESEIAKEAVFDWMKRHFNSLWD